MNDDGLGPAVAGAAGLGEVVGPDRLRADAAAWDRLLARAAYPNPHHGRHVIDAHAAAGISAPRAFVLARHGNEILGLLPLSSRRARFGFRPARAGWTSPFAPNGTPLLAADRPDAAARALLAGLVRAPSPAVLRIPFAALDSLAAAALRREAARLGLAAIERCAFERPVLDRGDAWAKSGKSVARRRGQLAALGALEHRVETGGEGLVRAVEAFLDIEARGWKGRRGTAMASRPATAGLARRLFAEGAAGVAPRADLLTLDGRPVAVSLALLCGGTAQLLKTAFDEEYRRFGPGVMLEDAIVRDLARTGFAERLDSATVPGGVLDGLYPGRERIGELVIGLRPSLTLDELSRAAALEASLEALTARLKRLYWQLRAGNDA